MEREGLEYLVRLGREDNPIVETSIGTYARTRDLFRLKAPAIETLQVSNLTSLIDYVQSNVDELKYGKLLIQVVSPAEVRLLTPLNQDNERQEILRAIAILPRNIVYEQFVDTERFNIMLQSSFADKGDKLTLLKFTGLIKDETVKQTGDNGVSQKVTIKTGVASVGEAEVPNPVTLAPYRTFPEIEQVESKFIFRMKDGPIAALFEADGGAWQNEVMLNIRKYLLDELILNDEWEDKIEIIS